MSPDELAAWEAEESAQNAAHSHLCARLQHDLERFPSSAVLRSFAVLGPDGRVVDVGGGSSLLASAYCRGEVSAREVVMAERAQLVGGAKSQRARLVAAKFVQLALRLKAKTGAQVTRLVRQLAPVARSAATMSLAVIQATAALLALFATATTTWRRAGTPTGGWLPPPTTSPILSLAAAPGAPSLAV